MTKFEYLEELRWRLARLPQDEFESAVAFYTEYLDDAGEDLERVLENLGTPAQLARQILQNSQYRETQIPPSTPYFSTEENTAKSRSGLSAGTIALLFVTSPVWFPLLLAVLIVFFVLWLVVFIFLFVLGICALAFLAAGVICAVAAVWTVSVDFPSALYSLGGAIFCIGLAILSACGAAALVKKGIPAMGKGCVICKNSIRDWWNKR